MNLSEDEVKQVMERSARIFELFLDRLPSMNEKERSVVVKYLDFIVTPVIVIDGPSFESQGGKDEPHD